MIGDNPDTDIKGANNAGDHWVSVMVKSGIFQGENHDVYPAKHVVEDIEAAVELIFKLEGLELKF